ncbi:MAG: amidase family protein, partial [Chloroflexota bacterium]
ALASSRADADAFIVSRLRQAGAVILGKVNLSEWANFMTSASANGFSTVGGHTRNPYGRFDVGGSSSGSAVAVAAGFAPLTVGTETAGSLVYPASQNAVVTLKPSVGLISRDRIIPITDRQDTAGPMARTVREAALLAGVLSGLDAADPITAQAEQISAIDYTAFLDVDALRGVRVAVVSREEVYREGDAAIVEAVIARLTAAGAEVVTVPPLEMRIDYLPILFYGFHAGVNHYLQTVAQNTPVRTIEELIAFNAADMDNRAPFGQDLIERALTYELTTEEQADYDQTAESNRETAGAMIREVLNTHNAAIMVDLSNYSTAIYAPAGFPAVTLPAGYRETGEPIGVTLIGDYLDDPRLLAYAYALEQVEPVRRPPPLD